MTDFQILITDPTSDLGSGDTVEEGCDFEVRQNARGGDKAVATIDELAEIWDVVADKLTTIAARTKEAAEKSPYEMDTITFNVGIEAGLSVGLVTKGNASVSVSFKRKAS